MPTARSPLCALVRPRFRARSRTAMSIRQIPLSAASLSRAEDASAPPTRAGFAAFCLFASWTTETYSHVDRLWSITPAVYACMYALLSGWDPRCTLMALLSGEAVGLAVSVTITRCSPLVAACWGICVWQESRGMTPLAKKYAAAMMGFYCFALICFSLAAPSTTVEEGHLEDCG